MILINGEPKDAIAATDRGLHYGDGVFETIAIHNGEPQFWPAHVERLFDGCSRLGIPRPDVNTLVAETNRLCAGRERAVLKIIITRGSGGRGYRPPAIAEPQRILIRYPWPEYSDLSAGITLRICQTPLSCNPMLAGIKHLNRLEQVLARNEWTDESIHEGLMLDTEGNVIEGTMSNLFAVRDGRLLTPELKSCGVAGVMRKQVLSLAEELGIACDVLRIRVEELKGMDELFVTNSIIGIWPVAQLDGTSYGDARITANLASALKTAMEKG